MSTPKLIVVVAGISESVSPYFEKKLQVFAPSKYVFVWLPLGPNGKYDDEYISSLYSLFYKKISENVAATGALLIYCDHENSSIHQLEKAFHIETFMIKMPPIVHSNNGRSSPNQLQSVANKIQSELKSALKEGKKIIDVIRKEITSNDNKTPLLLPLVNFDDGKMSLLAGKINELIGVENTFQKFQEIKKNFIASVSQTKIDGSPKRYFINSKDLIFKSPGANRHGFSRLSAKGHREQCFVRGNIRFGAYFDPNFHYDCEYKKRKLNLDWASCHGQSCVLKKGRKHVNIAPNDNVR